MCKKILMASVHHWTSPCQVGSHALARCFARNGYQVAFISSPLTPLHLLRPFKSRLIERLRDCRSGGRSSMAGRVWSYVPFALVAPDTRPGLRSDFILHQWAKSTIPNVVAQANDRGFGNVDVLYIDNIFQYFWLNAINFKKTVFRIMDHHLGFPGTNASMKGLARNIARSVDVVVYSAESLADYVASLDPQKSAYVPNGVDLELFAEGSQEMPPVLQSIPKPIAVYVGVMDVWFDFSLLRKAAECLPNVSFVLIGPKEKAENELNGYPNIHLLGAVQQDQLAPYLRNCDVGIIPFNVNRYPKLIHNVNPLKLYEYMACGLPVVSTEWEELSRINSPATLCGTAAEFVQSIAASVDQFHDKEEYIKFARQRDWSVSFATLLRALQDS